MDEGHARLLVVLEVRNLMIGKRYRNKQDQKMRLHTKYHDRALEAFRMKTAFALVLRCFAP